MPEHKFEDYTTKVREAASRVDLTATEAQRKALNAKTGPVHIHGLDLVIEFPKGSIRRGTAADGTQWARKMAAHYGRIKRTKGHDDMAVDFYLGEHPESQLVFVISQLTKDGELDEHKCVLGCRNYKEAKELYLKHYPKGWEDTGLGEIRMMTTPTFKKWLKSKCPVKNKTKTTKSAFVMNEIQIPSWFKL